jgi:nitrite reductase/ring-hydroxylating ferredoxin subunit
MTPLCKQDALAEGSARGFDINGVPVFAVRKNGEVFAYHNSCPHIGVPLEWLPDQFLDSEGELIQCATHGALFVIETGVCVAGPCVGDALEPLPLVIRDGVVYLGSA